jgi:small subunit ribosomal protein S8
MSFNDPVADMLTRIRNAQSARKFTVEIPHSKLKDSISEVLLSEGYIKSIDSKGEGTKKMIAIELKYFEGKPVIDFIDRVSRPGLRAYKPKNDLPNVLGGLGCAIVSTSQGVMTDREARQKGIGGEVLCVIS